MAVILCCSCPIGNGWWSRIESYISVWCSVMVPGAIHHSVVFEEGETIWTESSYKYSLKGFQRLSGLAGFKLKKYWVDPDRLFAVLANLIARKGRAKSAKPAKSSNPSPAMHDSERTLPTEIPGIDVRDGVKRVAGNEQLYEQLLFAFLSSKGDAVKEIEDALSVGDNETAERLAHGIKGVAGSISANGVYGLAQDLEAAIKSGGADDIDAAMEQLAPELDKVIGSLQSIFGRK